MTTCEQVERGALEGERLQREILSQLDFTQTAVNFDIDTLARMERQMIPLLNTIRQLQGKRPVIVPGENRTRNQL